MRVGQNTLLKKKTKNTGESVFFISSLSRSTPQGTALIYGETASGGLYVESDPIGLAGGQFSTYAYVEGNPLWYIDEDGLMGNAPGHGAYPAGQGPGGQSRAQSACMIAGGIIGAAGVAALPEIAGLVSETACRIAPKLKNPCKNALLAAALGTGICNGDPADDFVSDMERRETIRQGTELAGQKKIGIQQQRP